MDIQKDIEVDVDRQIERQIDGYILCIVRLIDIYVESIYDLLSQNRDSEKNKK